MNTETHKPPPMNNNEQVMPPQEWLKADKANSSCNTAEAMEKYATYYHKAMQSQQVLQHEGLEDSAKKLSYKLIEMICLQKVVGNGVTDAIIKWFRSRLSVDKLQEYREWLTKMKEVAPGYVTAAQQFDIIFADTTGK